jgi:hypothetical protein
VALVVEWTWEVEWEAQWESNMKSLNIDWKYIVMGVMMCLIFLMAFYYDGKVDNLQSKTAKTEKLLEAITDKMDSVVVENNTLQYSKKTLQADIKELEGLKESLSDEQNKLVAKVAKTNKEKMVIAAALIKARAELAGIKGKTGFMNDTTLLLHMNTDSLSYRIEINGVGLVKDSAEHIIKSLIIPNEQYIEFKWGSKKEGYPVSFSITNTSPYMKTNNIESYIIPDIKKEEIKPNFLQKVNNFFGANRKPFFIGVAAGAAGVLILTR